MRELKEISRLSYELLERTAMSLESSFINAGRFNFLIAKYAGNASLVLDYQDLVIRFRDLLEKITPELYWENMEPRSDKVPDYSKTISTISVIRENHPPFPKDIHKYLDPYIIGFNEEHLLLCLRGNYEEAFELAETDLAKEEVLLTQVVFGDIQNALRKRDFLDWESRRNGILFVAAIESFRLGEIKLGEEILELLELNDWMMAYMALGIENYIPWMIYPYPDY